ncbi:MAG: dTMP kinase [Methanosarcinaceae archaeon]|nr:dTMP kinase [Methanosarcinaceae archaeon]
MTIIKSGSYDKFEKTCKPDESGKLCKPEKSGKLITFEGIDGAGKTTTLELLKESGKLPASAVFTREPTKNTFTGDFVYESFEKDIDPLSELFLFLADHSSHLENVIKPELKLGKIVISDRYSDSRISYQGVTLENIIPNSTEFIEQLHKPWTVVPDLTFYFDLPPEVSIKRCKNRDEITKFEKKEFLEKVRKNFLKLKDKYPSRIYLIDATKPQNEILDEIHEVILKLIND